MNKLVRIGFAVLALVATVSTSSYAAKRGGRRSPKGRSESPKTLMTAEQCSLYDAVMAFDWANARKGRKITMICEELEAAVLSHLGVVIDARCDDDIVALVSDVFDAPQKLKPGHRIDLVKAAIALAEAAAEVELDEA